MSEATLVSIQANQGYKIRKNILNTAGMSQHYILDMLYQLVTQYLLQCVSFYVLSLHSLCVCSMACIMITNAKSSICVGEIDI